MKGIFSQQQQQQQTMAFRFLGEVKIDFEAIEAVIQERGKQIDWRIEYEDYPNHWIWSNENWTRMNLIYDRINDGCADRIEEGNLTTPELIEWIIDELLSKCEEKNVKIIDVDNQN